MVDCYLGEIRMFGGNYAPEGWEICDGRTLPVSGNEALFSLLGNLYGGSAPTNFALPDLRGRLPVHVGQGTNLTNRVQGTTAGAEGVALTVAQLAAHTHTLAANSAGAITTTPSANVTYGALTGGWLMYTAAGATVDKAPFAANAVKTTGSSGPHPNVMPGVVLSYIIATTGIYPTPA